MLTTAILNFIQLLPATIRWVASIVFISLSCHGFASAQSLSSDISIEAVLGFSETVRLGNWAPLSVTLENKGQLIEGTLNVGVTSGNQLDGTVFTVTHQRSLELSSDARKRFRFTVFIDNFSTPIQIQIISENKVLARQTIDLTDRFTDSRLLVVLSKTADLDYLNAASAHQLRVSYPHPETLPYQWQGYDGVSAMIVHGVSLERWHRRQFSALEGWISQGGTLVVSGGPNYAILRTNRLAQLLPAQPSGLSVIKDDRGFRETLGSSFAAPRSFQIHRVLGAEKQSLLSANGLPLIIEKRFGHGRILYLTFDIGAYPFSGWEGMASLWLRFLTKLETDLVSTLPTVKANAASSLHKDSNRRYPHRLIVVSFIVAYLGFVFAIYRNTLQHSQANIWIVWLAPLTFIPGAFILFSWLLSPSLLSAASVSLITLNPGSPYARLDLDIGFYSNRSGLSSILLKESNGVFLPGIDENRRNQATDWIYAANNALRLQALDPRPYRLHTVRGTNLVSLELNVTANVTEDGLQVSLDNQSYQSLRYAWMIYNGWLYPLGAIDGNGRYDHQVRNDEVVSVHDRNAISEHLETMSESRKANFQMVFEHKIKDVRDNSPLQDNEALFIALPADSPPITLTDKMNRTRDVTLIISRIAVSPLTPPSIERDATGYDAR